VRVGDSAPLSLLLDTGAYTILDTQRARAIGVRLDPVGRTDSIGADQQTVHVVRDKVSFTLPGIEFTSPRVLGIPLDKVQACIDAGTIADGLPRMALDGILGKEFFAALVVEIDYAGRLLHLNDPATYDYEGRGEILPLEIAPQHVFVRAEITSAGQAVPARLLVDTGAATALRLTRRFVARHGIMPPREKLKEVPECGLGGYAKERALEGTLHALRIGKREIGNPLTVFSQIDENVPYDGFLGGMVLETSRRSSTFRDAG
jgi:predicted aspartyl protease